MDNTRWLAIVSFLGSYQVIQSIVMAITAGLVCWYALEAQKLTKEMVHQNQINLRPVVVPVVRYEPNQNKTTVKLKNIGGGVAFNVSIEPSSDDPAGRVEYRFGQLTFLASCDEAEVECGIYSNNVRQPLPSRAYFDFFAVGKRITILFGDVEGGEYRLEADVAPPEKTIGDRDIRLGSIHKR